MRVSPTIILLTSFLATPATAFCFDPSFSSDPPEPPTIFYRSKPSVPYCLSSYSYTHKHTCSQWELDSYFDDVDRYVREMRSYYDDAVAFANEATEYANDAIRFSENVYNYATCEIKDVNSQHE